MGAYIHSDMEQSIIYTIIKTTSIGNGRLSVVGVVDTRYGVSQPGADAER